MEILNMKRLGMVLIPGLALLILASCRKIPDSRSNCTLGGSISAASNLNEDTLLINNLLRELKQLSEESKCTTTDIGKFVEFGENTCGGPIGYLAYNANSDSVCFLKKVAHFNLQHKALNKKYSLSYPCVVPKTPVSVICKNGHFELQY